MGAPLGRLRPTTSPLFTNSMAREQSLPIFLWPKSTHRTASEGVPMIEEDTPFGAILCP